jgi:hypothetical protein
LQYPPLALPSLIDLLEQCELSEDLLDSSYGVCRSNTDRARYWGCAGPASPPVPLRRARWPYWGRLGQISRYLQAHQMYVGRQQWCCWWQRTRKTAMVDNQSLVGWMRPRSEQNKRVSVCDSHQTHSMINMNIYFSQQSVISVSLCMPLSPWAITSFRLQRGSIFHHLHRLHRL